MLEELASSGLTLELDGNRIVTSYRGVFQESMSKVGKCRFYKMRDAE